MRTLRLVGLFTCTFLIAGCNRFGISTHLSLQQPCDTSPPGVWTHALELDFSQESLADFCVLPDDIWRWGVTDAGSERGNVMTYTGPSTRTFIHRPPLRSAEIRLKAKTESTPDSIGIMFRAWDGGELLHLLISPGNAAFYKIVNGRRERVQGVSQAAAASSWEPGHWYQILLTSENDQHRAKWWKDGEAEPSSWMLSVTDNRVHQGLAGLTASGSVMFDDLNIQPQDLQEARTETKDNLFYEVVAPNKADISIIASRLNQPTRLTFTPDGNYLLISELPGTVRAFQRQSDGSWALQAEPFFDLGNLSVGGERGLTAVYFGADFDASSAETAKRDVFLSYQSLVDGVPRNQITRVTFTPGQTITGTDPVVIYQGPNPGSAAHQIQDGIGFLYEGAPHILVSVGDGGQKQDSPDPLKESHGKLLLMQRDGSDPLGQRPYPEAPKVQAVGIRNAYGITMLPEALDQRRRVLGVENGDEFQDRIWFLEVIDFNHEVDAALNLGYQPNGGDKAASWASVLDANTPGPLKTEGVLALLDHFYSPTSIRLHPGNSVLPAPSEGNATVILSTFGATHPKNDPHKGVFIGELRNLTNQPFLALTPLLRRSPAASETYLGIAGLAVDPLTGDILFADLFTGDLYKVTVQEFTSAPVDLGPK